MRSATRSRTTWVGLLAAGAIAGAIVCAAPAAAAPEVPEPAPPPPAPAGLIPPLAAIGSVLAQSDSEPVGPLGLPDLSAYASSLLLGQTAGPPGPGAPDPAVIPDLTAFNTEYLLPLNTAPAAPGQGVPAPGIAPDAQSPGTGRIAFLRRLNEMYQAGALHGALLGQLPMDQLGEPPAPPPAG